MGPVGAGNELKEEQFVEAMGNRVVTKMVLLSPATGVRETPSKIPDDIEITVDEPAVRSPGSRK